jgi:hypothetical protein
MPQREFANQKALVAYAEQNDFAYEYEYTLAFAKRQRLLSPEQYEIVEVRTSRGVSDAVLEGHHQAEREALVCRRRILLWGSLLPPGAPRGSEGDIQP